jgi:uncharacterized protein
MALDPGLMALLACPACRKPLSQPDESSLRCAGCGKSYPVIDGIPRLIVE